MSDGCTKTADTFRHGEGVAQMRLIVTIGNVNYTVDLSQPRHIAIPVRFDEKQLSVFGAPPARSQPFTIGDFVGSVSRGGSCNCDVITFVPHTSGTHTECVGHISGTP